jgi:hypothetical protein
MCLMSSMQPVVVILDLESYLVKHILPFNWQNFKSIYLKGFQMKTFFFFYNKIKAQLLLHALNSHAFLIKILFFEKKKSDENCGDDDCGCH